MAIGLITNCPGQVGQVTSIYVEELYYVNMASFCKVLLHLFIKTGNPSESRDTCRH